MKKYKYASKRLLPCTWLFSLYNMLESSRWFHSPFEITAKRTLLFINPLVWHQIWIHDLRTMIARPLYSISDSKLCQTRFFISPQNSSYYGKQARFLNKYLWLQLYDSQFFICKLSSVNPLAPRQIVSLKYRDRTGQLQVNCSNLLQSVTLHCYVNCYR